MTAGNTASNNVQLGYYLTSSNNNVLIGNVATNNSLHGFYITNSDNNNLTRNIAINNVQYGFSVTSSSDSNLIYYNFILDNNNNGDDDSSSTNWTNDTHGNYWKDYSGLDSNNDGIRDTNYTLDGTTMANDTMPLVSTLNVTDIMDFAINEGTTGHKITWNASTNLLTTEYDMYQNDTLITTGLWNTAAPVKVNVDGLAFGNL